MESSKKVTFVYAGNLIDVAPLPNLDFLQGWHLNPEEVWFDNNETSLSGEGTKTMFFLIFRGVSIDKSCRPQFKW